jgi:hypothetical protein
MLLESELKLKTSRMEAAQQQLASEAQEHQAKQALLQKQLEQYKVGWVDGCMGALKYSSRGGAYALMRVRVL